MIAIRICQVLLLYFKNVLNFTLKLKPFLNLPIAWYRWIGTLPNTSGLNSKTPGEHSSISRTYSNTSGTDSKVSGECSKNSKTLSSSTILDYNYAVLHSLVYWKQTFRVSRIRNLMTHSLSWRESYRKNKIW